MPFGRHSSKANVHKIERHPNCVDRPDIRLGNRNTLTIQDANHLCTHPCDVVLDGLGLRWRDVRLKFREGRLRPRCDENRFNFGQQFVGVLATRKKMQSLRPVQVTKFRRVVYCAHNREALIQGVIFPEGRLRRTPTPESIVAEAGEPVTADRPRSDRMSRLQERWNHFFCWAGILPRWSSRKCRKAANDSWTRLPDSGIR